MCMLPRNGQYGLGIMRSMASSTGRVMVNLQANVRLEYADCLFLRLQTSGCLECLLAKVLQHSLGLRHFVWHLVSDEVLLSGLGK
jgi:hypothetical protein